MKRLVPSAVAVCAVQAFAAAASPADAELAQLERRYLACDRIASAQRLAPGDAAECSWVSEQLLRQRFGPELYGVVFEASPSRLARWQGTLSADASTGPGSCTAA